MERIVELTRMEIMAVMGEMKKRGEDTDSLEFILMRLDQRIAEYRRTQH